MRNLVMTVLIAGGLVVAGAGRCAECRAIARRADDAGRKTAQHGRASCVADVRRHTDGPARYRPARRIGRGGRHPRQRAARRHAGACRQRGARAQRPDQPRRDRRASAAAARSRFRRVQEGDRCAAARARGSRRGAPDAPAAVSDGPAPARPTAASRRPRRNPRPPPIRRAPTASPRCPSRPAPTRPTRACTPIITAIGCGRRNLYPEAEAQLDKYAHALSQAPPGQPRAERARPDLSRRRQGQGSRADLLRELFEAARRRSRARQPAQPGQGADRAQAPRGRYLPGL